jgi:hypothetical protein
MPHSPVHDLASLKQLIDEQEAQGIRFQFQGWAIRLPDGDYVYGAHTVYGITMRKVVVTTDQGEARRIARKNRGELVEFWMTPKLTLAIARKGGDALWWDAKVTA